LSRPKKNNNLQRKIYFNNNPEYYFSPGWCLNELDENNKQIDRDYYLFPSSVGFFVSSHLQIKTNYNNKKNKTTQDVVITASLSPQLERPVVYEMFGTDRRLKNFTICIHHNQSQSIKELFELGIISKYNKEDEWCELSAMLETEFCDDEFNRSTKFPDDITVYVFINEERFNKILSLIESKQVEQIMLRLYSVDGFYSEWLPSPTYLDRIKILTKEHILEANDNNKVDILRVGSVGGFDIMFESKIDLQKNIGVRQDFCELSDDKLEKIFKKLSSCDLKNNEKEMILTFANYIVSGLKLTIWLIFTVVLFILILKLLS